MIDSNLDLTQSAFLLFLCSLAVIEIKLSSAEPIYNADPANPANTPEVASFSDYPFMVSIGLRGRPGTRELFGFRQGHFCGGALITIRHVLTAAHCFDNNERKGYVRVLIGISNFNENPEVIEVDGWTKYVDWTSRGLDGSDHDIAVLKLRRDVTTPNAVPIPLYERNTDTEGLELESIGWGKTEQYETSPNLLKIPLIIVPRKKCQDKFKEYLHNDYEINSWYLCTRSTKELYIAPGDSGGPVLYKDGSVFKLFAVNQAQCENTCLMLNIHSRVRSYLDFIRAMIAQ